MKLQLRGKLFAVSLGLIVASELAGELYLGQAVEANLLARIRDDLQVRLALISDAVRAAGREGAPRWDELADRLSPVARGRVTFIDAAGVVLGDSDVAGGSLASVENHRARPEVAAALAGRAECSTRYSATVRQRFMYAAAPMELPAGAHGAVRLAVPLDLVDAAMARQRHILWAALGVAFLVAVVLSSVAAEMLSRPLRRMTEAAQRMTGGDLEARLRPAGTDETAALGRALDTLAESLAATLTRLRGERDLLSSILTSMHEGVLVLDAEDRMVLVNPALRATLSLPPDPEGRAALELIRNADLQAMLQRARAGAAGVTGEIETAGPAPRRLLVHAASLPVVENRPQGLLAVFVDVTEIRRLESLRRDFVANVSHELRTPITAARSAVDTLRMTLAGDPAASARFVDIIDRNTQRLGALVEDLLELSRMESKEFHPDATAVSLRAVSDQVVGLLRARADENRIEVVNEIPSELAPARADRRAVEQVLTNLLDNALKYGGEGARITVRAAASKSDLRIEVADTRPGIEARHLPRLFERFYRVDSGRSREMGGTGLGLSIVKHLVEAMGGTTGVESAAGHGSTFWFTLPAAEEHEL